MPASTSGSSADSLAHWNQLFSGPEFFYGQEPGPIARRAEKYHRAARTPHSTALDVGCGEGQDLVFLSEAGYDATGLDFSPPALDKARALLQQRQLHAQVLAADLAHWKATQQFDLVLCVNVLGFTGELGDAALGQVLASVAPGGVLGLSVWAREEESAPAIQDGVRLWTRREIFGALEDSGSWQKREAVLLWQYFDGTDDARPFVTLVAQRIAQRI